MKTRKRIDRFTEDALNQFASWFLESKWIGKERDCVNIFVTNHLMRAVGPNAAVTERSQIHIEGNIRQFDDPGKKTAVSKDVVVWGKPNEVTWNSDWQAVNVPRVVIEWKVRRSGHIQMYDKYDIEWLEKYTAEFPKVFGYAVSVGIKKRERIVHITKVRHGKKGRTKTTSRRAE